MTGLIPMMIAPFTTGRGGVVSFVEDEEGPRCKVPQPGAQRGGVLLIAEQRMREDEGVMGLEGVDLETPFAPPLRDVPPIQHHERETEPLLELVAPLVDHGRRAGHQNPVDLLAHEQLAEDETRFDGLAEAYVVGDEQVDTREGQGFAKWLELVVHDLDASTVGCLEQPGIGGGDAAPAPGMEERAEGAGIVESPGFRDRPVGSGENFRVELGIPEHLEGRITSRLLVRRT